MYTLDHLATFSCGSNQGLHHPLDAINKLRLLEKSSGIWAQRMKIKLEKKDLLIQSFEDNIILEKFPFSKILEPTAVITEDPNEIYNNILMFTAIQDYSKKKGAILLSEIHLFQCVSVSAQEIVDEINRIKSGTKYKKIPKSYYVPPQQQYSSKSMLNLNEIGSHKSMGGRLLHNQSFSGATSPHFMDHSHSSYPYDGHLANTAYNNNKAYMSPHLSKDHSILPRESLYSYSSHDIDGAESIASQQTEHDVMMLNHCFDDIENFIAKLQHSNAAFKELEKRQKMNNKKSKNVPGSAMLSLHARPPTENEFVDIFQKFKLAFNLLARLKNYIHDPNAPELIHFLFTPLAMIVDATKRIECGPSLTSHIVTPLLTNRAVELLHSCLSSKENELWQSLGDAWIYPQDHFQGYPGSFSPLFCNGWQPHYEMTEMDKMSAAGSLRNGRFSEPNPGRREIMRDQLNYIPPESYGNKQYKINDTSPDYRFPSPSRPLPTYPSSPPPLPPQHGFKSFSQADTSENQTSFKRDPFVERMPGGISSSSDFDKQKRFINYIKDTRSKAYEVMFDRTSKHEKELTVRKGEVLQIIDDSRNWWKARNFKDEIGFVPYTILRPFSYIYN